jgi:hypothetical protein
MKWNLSRIKVLFVGIIGVVFSFIYILNVETVLNYLTPFEQIVLLYLGIVTILPSLFFMFWGMEPIMPELKWGVNSD